MLYWHRSIVLKCFRLGTDNASMLIGTNEGDTVLKLTVEEQIEILVKMLEREIEEKEKNGEKVYWLKQRLKHARTALTNYKLAINEELKD